MFSVGLDVTNSFVLYSKLINVKLVNNKNCFSDELKQTIFGSTLGRGKLDLPPKGENVRFGLTLSLEKKDYFLSLLNIFSEINSVKFREMSDLDQRTGRIYTNLNF
jgi:hypothetical protein